MCPRRFLALSLLAPLALGGCGAVSTVRTAFEMPVAPTPSARELARAKETHNFDSLSKAVAQLDTGTIRKIFGSSAVKNSGGGRQTWQPIPFSGQPAFSLSQELQKGTTVPAAPHRVALSRQLAPEQGYAPLTPLGNSTTRTLAARRLFAAPLHGAGGAVSESARAFLEAWAARESLRRSDEELLGRRALEDRIALQSRSALPALDLSLVSPETQLELTNLRLQLVPLLKVAPARRLGAVRQIEVIEARLNQIWAQETARQAALLQQSLVEVPARLRREGEGLLSAQTLKSAAQTQERIAQVGHDLETRRQLPAASTLNIVQGAAKTPDAVSVRGQLSLALPGTPTAAPIAPVTVSGGASEIAARGANPSSGVPERVAAKNERIWRAATR